MTDQRWDEIVDAIRKDTPEPAVVETAAGRVRERLLAGGAERGSVEACGDFQALMPAYLAQTLSPARALLLEDHAHSCVDCRRALAAARSGNTVTLERPKTVPARLPDRVKWAVAAMLAVAVGAGTWATIRAFTVAPGSRATVQAVHGILYEVADRTSTPIFSGREIGEREKIRTSKDSSAVLRLSDGSLVEMNERSELFVSRAARGTTIHLDRGNIIVQAAKQHDGALYVNTTDCQVSVKGTIFAVTRGTKGSRVSVVEGAVKVDRGQHSDLLHPGNQVSTDASLAGIPVEDDIAWSRNAGRYLAVLGELSTIQKQLEQTPGPALRHNSKLLGYVPRNVVLYAAIPNLGPTLAEADRILQDRMQQSEVLREWWSEQQATDGQPKLADILNKVRAFSDYLGDEIVLTVASGPNGRPGAPVLMAEIKRPGLEQFLQEQLQTLGGKSGMTVRVVDTPSAAAADGNALYLYVQNGVFAAAPQLDSIQYIDALATGRASNIGGSRFNSAIEQAYETGAGWLLCVDIQQIMAAHQSAHPGATAALDGSGLSDARYLILERKEIAGVIQNQASLAFWRPRRGLVSWLAAPAPMGALEFVSPNASLAAAFVLRNPREMISELFEYAGAKDSGFAERLAQFEHTTGVQVVNDLADPLGGDVAFAMDGPLLPIPSWKMAVEVYNPGRLQTSIEKLVDAFNREAGQTYKAALAREQSGSQTFYTLTFQSAESAKLPAEIHYVFVDSYLVAAANRDLLTSAIQNRQSGFTLTRSAQFRERLPRNGNPNFSGILYHNVGTLMAPALETLKSSGALTPAQRQSLDALTANSAPGLIYAYAESDRITLAATGGLFGLNLDTLALPKIMEQAMRTQRSMSASKR